MSMNIDIAKPFSLFPYWKANEVQVLDKANGEEYSTDELVGNFYQCPLHLRWEDEPDEALWTLPIDPVISVQGGNTIVRSNVLKQEAGRSHKRGSIKEVWSQDDYEIKIAGFVQAGDGDMPAEDILRLRAYCEERKTIYVENDLLELFDITRIVISKYSFDHTPGRENQQFSIQAYSDDDFELVL